MGNHSQIGSKRRTRRDVLYLLLFLALAVVLATLPHERQLALATALRSSVLAPVLKLRSGVSDMSDMRLRVQDLRAERDSLSARVLSLQNVAEENARLRELLQLAERDSTVFVPANLYVVGRMGEQVERSFVVDVGSAAGVRRENPVVALAGLVGVIRAAGKEQATGDFWTHPEFRVSAMTEDGRVFGIIRSLPGTPYLMRLDGAPYQLELEMGTRLVTSGQGGVFPRGIPIGTVAALTSAEAGWSKSYDVRPAVYPDETREVMVLIENGDPADMTEIWKAPATAAGG